MINSNVILFTLCLWQSGYMIYDRVLRPAEVGVTEGGVTEGSDDKTE